MHINGFTYYNSKCNINEKSLYSDTPERHFYKQISLLMQISREKNMYLLIYLVTCLKDYFPILSILIHYYAPNLN